VISSVKQKKGRPAAVDKLTEPGKFASNGWHADITFEQVSSDYAMLKIHTLPTTGGDTVGFPSPISVTLVICIRQHLSFETRILVVDARTS